MQPTDLPNRCLLWDFLSSLEHHGSYAFALPRHLTTLSSVVLVSEVRSVRFIATVILYRLSSYINLRGLKVVTKSHGYDLLDRPHGYENTFPLIST